jgi:tryptophanyl-tRNA synthetase
MSDKQSIPTGIFVYPALMAADIILYDADYVPVGIDQKQHVELTRDLAIRFNSHYSDTFKVPEPVIAKSGSKIYSLSDPTKKMSKSESDKGTIYLLEDVNIARKKIMSAVTDLGHEVKYDPENKPGISNLLTIMSSLNGVSIEDLEKQFAGKGYGDFKKAVADVVVNFLTDMQNKVAEIKKSGIIDKVLEDGAQKASYVARKKLAKVYRKVGLR